MSARSKPMRFANRWDVLSWETVAVMERARPFVVALLCPSGRSTSFAATTATEAEEYAAGELKRDGSLFAATVWYNGQLVSSVLPC